MKSRSFLLIKAISLIALYLLVVADQIRWGWQNVRHVHSVTVQPLKNADDENNSTGIVSMNDNEHDLKQEVIRTSNQLRIQDANENTTITTPAKILTTVVETTGELGNNLQLLTHGIYFKQWAKEEHNVSVQLWLHQSRGKLRKSAPTYLKIQKCFPNLAQTYGFLPASNEQDWEIKQWQDHQEDLDKTLFEVPFPFDSEWVQTFLKQQRSRKSWNLSTQLSIPSTFDLPFAYIPMERNKNRRPSVTQLEDVFHFDTNNCCKTFPSPNETVLHIRAFNVEVPNFQTQGKDLYELDPDRTAQELLGHLEPGSPVVILSRFPKSVQPYVQALKKQGLYVSRIVSDQTDVEDFCFLMHATKVAGMTRSTFFNWALLASRQHHQMAKIALDLNHQPGTHHQYRADVYHMYQTKTKKNHEKNKNKRKFCSHLNSFHPNVHCHEFPI